jgi:soluble lytic murein transglycosylase-like protein
MTLRFDRRLLRTAFAALAAIELLAVAAGAILGSGLQFSVSPQPIVPSAETHRVETLKTVDLTPATKRVDLLATAPSPQALPFATFPAFTIPPIFPRHRPTRRSSVYEPVLTAAAARHGLPAELVLAVTRVESDFDPATISNKGALGLMQLMPATAARFGVARHELMEPHRNAAAGTAYLAWLFDRYRGNLDLTLAAYNAGEGAVDKYGGVPPYRETQEYVRRVRAQLRSNR